MNFPFGIGNLVTCTKPRIYDNRSDCSYIFSENSLFLIYETPTKRGDAFFGILCPNGAKVRIHYYWLKKFVEETSEEEP